MGKREENGSHALLRSTSISRVSHNQEGEKGLRKKKGRGRTGAIANLPISPAFKREKKKRVRGGRGGKEGEGRNHRVGS